MEGKVCENAEFCAPNTLTIPAHQRSQGNHDSESGTIARMHDYREMDSMHCVLWERPCWRRAVARACESERSSDLEQIGGLRIFFRT